EAEIFEIDITSTELQDYSTSWCEDVYAHEPHGGLNKSTPTERAASCTGTIRRIDEQALDVLLAPIASGGGLRQVTKSGIRVNNEFYLIGNVMPGTTVFCRMDPADMGQIWVYDEEGEVFLGHAVAPALAGLNPIKTINAVRKMQKAIEDETITPIRKQMRKIGPRDVIHAVLDSGKENKTVVAFPKPEKHITTPALDAAKATRSTERVERKELADDTKALLAQMRGETTKTTAPKAERPAIVEPIQLTPTKQESRFDRYRHALRLAERIEAGQAVTERDSTWLKGYQQGSEFKAVLQLHKDFGDAAIDR
ncbi:MAG: Mu transposase C-terminal domain-containing protein, partial [Cohaesibacter sp.]|nr:Mu transposase C-terminal domain-containing protein [Cohaesibacter sp.]